MLMLLLSNATFYDYMCVLAGAQMCLDVGN